HQSARRILMRYISCSLMLMVAFLLAACGAAETGGGVAAPTQAAAATAPAQPTQAPAPTGAPAQPTTAPAEPTQAPAATQAAEPTAPAKPSNANQQSNLPKEGVLVIYQKTGGLKGINETLTVYADGRLELTNKGGAMKTTQVASADLSKLQRV